MSSFIHPSSSQAEYYFSPQFGDNSQKVSLLSTVPFARASVVSSGGGDLRLTEGLLSAYQNSVGEQEESYELPPQKSIYKVREGDSISRIANIFGVSENTIRWENEIGSDHISVGDNLVILPVSGVRHIADDGDTLSSIADTYDVPIGEIIEFNKLSVNETLSVGQAVIVPGGTIPEPPAEDPPVQQPSRVAESTSQSQQAHFQGYIAPVRGCVSQGVHGFNAVDIAAPTGTDIVAAASGTVIESVHSGWNGGYGLFVVIRHDNGTQSLYAHNQQNLVSRGDYVRQGQVIARVGSSGFSTGPHVHFEIRGGSRNPFTGAHPHLSACR